MIVKLQTEHYLEFLSLKGGCTGSSESTLVKLSHCWKSHASVHILIFQVRNPSTNLCLDTLGKDEKTVFDIGVFFCQGGASASEVKNF